MSTQHQNNQHPTHNKDDAPLQQPPIFLHLNGGCLHLFLHLNGGCLHQMQPENDASQGGKKISPTNLKVCSSLLLFRCTVSNIHPFADVTCDLRCDVSYSDYVRTSVWCDLRSRTLIQYCTRTSRSTKYCTVQQSY